MEKCTTTEQFDLIHEIKIPFHNKLKKPRPKSLWGTARIQKERSLPLYLSKIRDQDSFNNLPRKHVVARRINIGSEGQCRQNIFMRRKLNYLRHLAPLSPCATSPLPSAEIYYLSGTES